MELYRKCNSKIYLFLVIDTTRPLDNLLRFWKNLSEEALGVFMTINDKIKDEKLQYDIKMAAALLGNYLEYDKYEQIKILNKDEYDYQTGEEILPLQQHKIMQEAKFFYLPHGKELEKQTKTINENGKKQVEALQSWDLNNQQIQPYQP